MSHPDYDAGLLNDYGGGDVSWWQDYLRAEIGQANEHWRDRLEAAERRAAGLKEILASIDPWPDQPLDPEARPSDGYCELFVRHIILIREALAAKEATPTAKGDE